MDPLLAYIDPGSGSLIVQAVIATVIAVPIFFRHQFGRFFRVVRRQGDEMTSGAESSTSVTPHPRDD